MLHNVSQEIARLGIKDGGNINCASVSSGTEPFMHARSYLRGSQMMSERRSGSEHTAALRPWLQRSFNHPCQAQSSCAGSGSCSSYCLHQAMSSSVTGYCARPLQRGEEHATERKHDHRTHHQCLFCDRRNALVYSSVI